MWYNFYQGTSVSITFYIFEHYQLWVMDSKAQWVFFPKTPKLCVWHTEVRSCYHFKLVSHFQLWFPIWGVLVINFVVMLFCVHLLLPFSLFTLTRYNTIKYNNNFTNIYYNMINWTFNVWETGCFSLISYVSNWTAVLKLFKIKWIKL